jgi:hypothetical protein
VSRRQPRLAVIALALGATVLTASVAAQAEPPDTSSAVTTAPAASGTPLPVRPTRPLELAEEAPRSGVGWKLGALVALGAIGLYTWNQRRRPSAAHVVPNLVIVRRTAIGVRSELILVDMDGQRLLLGVTPNTIQNLYIVPPAEDDPLLESAPLAITVDRPVSLEVRRRAAEVEPAAPRAPRKAAPDFVEEQARGIRAIAERR